MSSAKRKITLVNVDDAGDAARNVTAAQQLVEEDKVFAHHHREQRGRRQRRVPPRPEDARSSAGSSASPVYGTYPNYFGMQNANTKNIKTDFTSRNADVIKALGGTKLAIVGSNSANSGDRSPSR